MSHRLPALLSCLLLSFGVSGCSKFQRARFNRGVGVDGEAVLVVPFSEPKNHRWYTESDRGVTVAEAFKWWVTDNADPNFPSGSAVADVLQRVRDWDRDSITIEDWQALTMGLGVKYVLVGEIEKLSLTSTQRIGMLDPVVEATYRLVNVETGKLAIQRPKFTVELEKAREIEIPSLELGSDLQAAEQRLLVMLAREIGQDLYGYYPE